MAGRVAATTVWMVLLLAAAVAADGTAIKPQGLSDIIRHDDTDGDGKVSRQEFRGSPERFKTFDADGDGFITSGELPTSAGDAKTPAGGGKWLTAEQLRLLIPGTEISHISPRSGSRVDMEFRPDGSLAGSVGAAGRPIDGSWEIRDDGVLCFETGLLDKRPCFSLVKHAMQLKRFNPRKEPMHGIDWIIVKPGPNAHLVP